MIRKIFSLRTWVLIAATMAMFCPFAQAKGYANRYQYEGTLVDIQERSVTIVNDEEKSVIHAVVPGEIHLTPGYQPGNKVYVTLTKTNIGLWNLVNIKKIE